MSAAALRNRSFLFGPYAANPPHSGPFAVLLHRRKRILRRQLNDLARRVAFEECCVGHEYFTDSCCYR